MFRMPYLSKRQHKFIRVALALIFLASIVIGSILGHLQPTQSHAAGTPTYHGSPLQLPWPTGAEHGITDGNIYNENDHGVTCCPLDQFALDFALSNTPVSAVAAGCAHIGNSQENPFYGNWIWILHPGNYVSVYAHLSTVDQSVYPASPNPF